MRFFRNLRFKQKIMVSYMAVIFCVLFMLTLSMDRYFTTTTTQIADRYTLQGIDQVNTSIESQLANIEHVIDMLALDTNVLEFLSWRYNKTDHNSQITSSNVRKVLSNAVETSNDITGVVVVNAYNFYISNELYHEGGRTLISDSWYQECMREGKLVAGRPADDRDLQYYFLPEAQDIVYIAKPIYLPNSSSPAGALLVDVDMQFMSRILENASWDKNGFVYILGRDDQVLYAPANDVVYRIDSAWFEDGSPNTQRKIGGQFYEFVVTRSEFTQWKAIGVFSVSDTLAPVVQFRLFAIVLMAAAALVSTVIVSLLSRSIVRPLLELRGLMQKAADRDLNVYFEVEQTDEIGELGQSFNTMVDEIRNLITMVWQEQRSKRKAELQVLQEQIKPHFLYNTFDTIHWIAKRYGAVEIVEIIRALTKMLRVGLSRGREVITAKEELQHAESYLTIQGIRYEEKLDYRVVLQGDCDDLYVQRLILQPLIENALYHGVKNRENGGKLLVEVRRLDDRLLLAVTDNGPGIPEERLREVRAQLEGGKGVAGYGLFNVNERIRISYGGEYGLKVRTKPGCYTRMEVHHPILTKAEAVRDDAPIQ